MIGPGNFLCGCGRTEKMNYAANVDPKGNISFKRYDKEGYEVCPEHGERLYGYQTHHKQGAGGQTLLDYTAYAASKIPRPLKLDFDNGIPDTRDNRDPLQMAEERQRLVEIESNGHATLP